MEKKGEERQVEMVSEEGWKNESEAPGRKKLEVCGDKQVKKMLIKHNKVKNKNFTRGAC